MKSVLSINQLQVAYLCFHATFIEDLCLNFTLPGYPDYVLKEGEGGTIVSDEVPY